MVNAPWVWGRYGALGSPKHRNTRSFRAAASAVAAVRLTSIEDDVEVAQRAGGARRCPDDPLDEEGDEDDECAVATALP